MRTQLIDPSQEMIPLNDAPAKAGGFTVELYNGADVLRTEHMGSRDEVLVFLMEIAGKVLTGHAYTDR